MKIYTKNFLLALSFSLIAFASNAQITWNNGNGTGLFSDPLNWSTAAVPSSADDVIFDGTSSANCTIDQDIQINNLTITAAYGGIIDGTSGNNRLIQTNNFSQAGGTFISTDDTYNVTGNMTLTGGTFNNNGGNVTIFINSGATISISGAFAFNDLTVTHPTPVTGVAQRNLNFGTSASAVSLNLSGTNRLYSYQGNINVTSDLTVLGTNTGNPTGNTGIFTLSGAGPLTILGTAGAGRNKLGNVTINTSGSLILSSQIAVQGTWTNSNIGSLSAGSSTVHFGGGASAAITSGTTSTTKAYFSNVNVLASSTLGITNGSFVDISGNFTQAGSFTPNTSLVQFTGSSAHAVNGTATLTSFNAIEKSGSGALTFGHTTNILDSLKITAGAVTGTNLVFKSTSALKGRLAEITGGSISGNITVETFIPGGSTDWANLGASGVSGLTFNSWYPTIPMAIEGSATDVTSAGGYFESVWRWDETSAFGYDSTVTVNDPINVGEGYWLFVGTSLSSSGPITTTVTGGVVSGNQPITLTNSAQGGSCLIANPFASPISWDRIEAANPGVTTGEIFIYNADLGLTTSYVGGVSTPGGVGSATSTIPMGQGFYVIANSSPLNIDESAKVSNNTSSDPLLKTSATTSTIGSVMYLHLTDGTYSDATAIRFHSNGTSGFDNGLDARKMFDSPGYLGYPGTYTQRTTISTKGATGFDYSINSLPYALSVPAVIPVLARVYATAQHTISASGTSNLAPGTCVILKDKFLNVTQDLKTGDYVCIISDTTTFAARFELTICPNITAGVNNNTPIDESVLVNQDRNGVYVDLKFEANTKAYITANNILGQQLMQPKQVECTSGKYYLDLNAKEQIIMVNVIANEKRTTKKVFIQQN